MIRWQDPLRPDDKALTMQDAARLYEEMWSVERVAELFGFAPETMRRLLARRTALRESDQRSRRLGRHRFRKTR
jgi:hypothetical protein